MDLEPIKVAFLAGLIASKGFFLIKLAALDAIVIAGSDRKAVDDVNRMAVQLLPGFSQQAEQAQEQVGVRVPATIKAAFAQQVRNVAICFEHLTSFLKISAKV